MKDKNMILLIGIILIWLFIIRPKAKNSNTETAETETTERISETVDETNANVSGYVATSKQVNEKTVSETKAVNDYPIRTYTM